MGETHEAGVIPHLPPQFRNAPAPGQLRHSHYSGTVGSQRRKDDDDLYSLRTEQDRERGKEPFGFLIAALMGSSRRTLFSFQATLALHETSIREAAEKKVSNHHSQHHPTAKVTTGIS